MQIHHAAALCTAVALGCLLRSSAHADTTADVRKTLQAVYSRRDAATEKKDVKGSLAALAPNFVFVSKDGQKGDINLLKRRLTPLLSLMQAVKSKSQVQKLSVRGKDATAFVKQHLEMVLINPQTQAPQKLVADATSEDVWTRTGAGWMQKRMTTRTETAALDGRSIDTRIRPRTKTGTHGAPMKKK